MMKELTIVITVILCLAILFVPRRFFLAPFLIAVCFIPMHDQRIILGGLDFNVLRILIVVGLLRLWLRAETRKIKWNILDKLLFLWAVVGALVYIIQWMTTQSAIYKCGTLFDIFGLYFLCRHSLQGWSDVVFILKVLTACILVLLPFVAYEWMTRHNPFIILGEVTMEVRQGRYRCNASFLNPILFGLFWTAIFPLFVALGFAERRKYIYWAAAAAAIITVLATASSTPIVTLILVAVLLPLFRYRKYGKIAVFALCGSILALHIIMTPPVWHLMARVDAVAGSTGWYRYHLIDQAVKHLSQWALLGTQSTENWVIPRYRAITDICNQYILEGVRGGIVTLMLFVAVLATAAKIAWEASLRNPSGRQQWLAWGICVSILGHCIAFWGVSYSGQIIMILYLTLAAVGSLAEISKRQIEVPVYNRIKNSYQQ